ncbi:hypothetical protein I302_103430 [Kwoniella bestiolae CBS 10118]|uniref:Integral membrane protein n=1 Tax=Kwoniella bestiolae CBS 10118 TaxID=1296100 RepID=A0A1B9G8D8_9TREE|nr:hypothetical protein I302_02130 [Kwoniella bestiolae CBS 10118]OCF27289.1 hypothetical protein I302_02130 [Kwoniella bestiolae CBS 10118]
MSEYGNYPVDLSEILWMSLASNSEKAIWWSTFAIVLQSFIVGSIISKTFQYFEYFKKSDNQIFLGFIGLGCALCIGTLMVTCAEMYKLIYHAKTEFHTIFRFIFFGDNTILLLGGIFNFTGGMYYAYRVWKMCNRKWWVIPPLAIGLCGPFGASLAVVVKGYQLPILIPQNLGQLGPYFADFVHTNKIWGGMTLSMDATLCVTLTILLMRSKDSVFANETRLFHKLMALMYESMFPPVIFLIIGEASGNMEGAPTTDWRKFVVTCIPCLYFHSVLSALVSRQTIRGLLNSKLASEGVNVLSNGTGGTGGGKKFVYPSSAYPMGSEAALNSFNSTSKHAEEGRGYWNDQVEVVERKSDNGSVVTVPGPLVKIEHEQNSAVSEPDSYASGHPHLSPVDGVSTANRDRPNRLTGP